MKLWVDADACPQVLIPYILKVAQRVQVASIFVANRALSLTQHPLVACVQVPEGPDQADAYMVAQAQTGDLAISQDVPLAAQLVAQGVIVITPYGRVQEAQNIAQRKATRDILQGLRDAGEHTRGPAPFGPKDKERFINALDKWLTKLSKA